ncbi:MAG: alanine/glycine:cation symporter family protein [Myxococcota bacterium]
MTLASGGDDGRVLLHALGSASDEPATVSALSEEPVLGLDYPRAGELVVARPGTVEVLRRAQKGFAVNHLIKTVGEALAVDGTGELGATARGNGQVSRFELRSGSPAAILGGHATEATLPFIVLWLVAGATFFTFRFGFVNLRAFRHAIDVTRGKFDDEHDDGDVSHFQALAMALSATVGLGNIAGVAVAVGTGGPGAMFWMIVAGFLGMSSKFAECTLGQMYRTIDGRGRVSGGPMHYLGTGLSELGMGGLGRVLAPLFAVMCIGGSLGGGNMFQANQSYAQVASEVTIFQGEIGALVYGLLLALLVGVVIIGGIDRIGQVASLIVPFMVGIYMLAAVFIVIANASAVPGALATIITGAFSPDAAFGGALGVLVTGFRRAAFSNEAGVGSASIAHSAAATKEPVREGIVALLEPFIDTIVVCTTTALVLVITKAYQTEADGVVMTSKAFATVIPWFPTVLTLAVFLFAFSTMISWSYYGERCWSFLFGEGSTIVFKIIFVAAVVLGSVIRLGSVLDFSDLMILAMSFPNIIGVVLLSGKVKARLNDYLERLRSGAMRPTQ